MKLFKPLADKRAGLTLYKRYTHLPPWFFGFLSNAKQPILVWDCWAQHSGHLDAELGWHHTLKANYFSLHWPPLTHWCSVQMPTLFEHTMTTDSQFYPRYKSTAANNRNNKHAIWTCSHQNKTLSEKRCEVDNHIANHKSIAYYVPKRFDVHTKRWM